MGFTEDEDIRFYLALEEFVGEIAEVAFGRAMWKRSWGWWTHSDLGGMH
jgi:hypothetical protein